MFACWQAIPTAQNRKRCREVIKVIRNHDNPKSLELFIEAIEAADPNPNLNCYDSKNHLASFLKEQVEKERQCLLKECEEKINTDDSISDDGKK